MDAMVAHAEALACWFSRIYLKFAWEENVISASPPPVVANKVAVGLGARADSSPSASRARKARSSAPDARKARSVGEGPEPSDSGSRKARSSRPPRSSEAPVNRPAASRGRPEPEPPASSATAIGPGSRPSRPGSAKPIESRCMVPAKARRMVPASAARKIAPREAPLTS